MCEVCGAARAAVKRSKNGAKVCKGCFYRVFEEEIHQTIVTEKMFSRGEKVCVAASGGKDSTVLAGFSSLFFSCAARRCV
jgi:cytoplasmic tRNA 2-thiolation protein 1